jgi:hypothetical protein
MIKGIKTNKNDEIINKNNSYKSKNLKRVKEKILMCTPQIQEKSFEKETLPITISHDEESTKLEYESSYDKFMKICEPPQINGIIKTTPNKFLINYNCGYGNALYITGDHEELGNWNIGTKLMIKNDYEWTFETDKIESQIEFKIFISKWIDGNKINLHDLKCHEVNWERPSGPGGNKITNFVNNQMLHSPDFRR